MSLHYHSIARVYWAHRSRVQRIASSFYREVIFFGCSDETNGPFFYWRCERFRVDFAHLGSHQKFALYTTILLGVSFFVAPRLQLLTVICGENTISMQSLSPPDFRPKFRRRRVPRVKSDYWCSHGARSSNKDPSGQVGEFSRVRGFGGKSKPSLRHRLSLLNLGS